MEDTRNRPKRNTYSILIAIMASMTSVLLGYDTGVMSGAVLYIKRDLNITDVQIEILVGTINLYSLVGSAMAGKTSDWLGRRMTIVIAAIIFFVGAVIMGFSVNYAMLMVGRFVAGLGVGYALMIAPVYAAEIAPASSRGFLTSFPEVFINLGVLLGYLSNFVFSKLSLKLGWRLMLGAGAVPSVFIGLGVLLMPESPRWLVMNGRIGEARRVLERTSDSTQEAQLRLDEIKEAAGLSRDCHDNSVPSQGGGVWRDIFVHPTRPVLHITIATVFLQFFQQASGIDVVVLYSPRIYYKAGIRSDNNKLLATILVGFCKMLFILVTTFMVDKVGRRVLLLASCGGMVLSMLTLASGLTVIDRNGPENHKWLVILCLITTYASVAFFSIGMGPVTWVYTSEIFPLRLRAQGAGLGVAVNRATSGVILMTFISLYKAITIGGTFFLFGGIGVIAWIFIFTLLPETRERRLEDMEVLFGTFFRWRTTTRDLAKQEPQQEEHEINTCA